MCEHGGNFDRKIDSEQEERNMRKFNNSLAALALFGVLGGGLAACGDSTLEQGILGAGAGAGAAIVLGGSAATAAVVGAAANVGYCKLHPEKCY